MFMNHQYMTAVNSERGLVYPSSKECRELEEWLPQVGGRLIQDRGRVACQQYYYRAFLANCHPAHALMYWSQLGTPESEKVWEMAVLYTIDRTVWYLECHQKALTLPGDVLLETMGACEMHLYQQDSDYPLATQICCMLQILVVAGRGIPEIQASKDVGIQRWSITDFDMQYWLSMTRAE